MDYVPGLNKIKRLIWLKMIVSKIYEKTNFTTFKKT